MEDRPVEGRATLKTMFPNELRGTPMSHRHILIAVAVVSVAIVADARAQIVNPANGHTYARPPTT